MCHPDMICYIWEDIQRWRIKIKMSWKYPMADTVAISDQYVMGIGKDGTMGESLLAELILFVMTWKTRLVFSMMVSVVLAVFAITARVFG